MNKAGHKKILNDLLTKEMNRKQFLMHLGMGIVAITGISAVLRALSGSQSSSIVTNRSTTAPRALGYGGSAYGE